MGRVLSAGAYWLVASASLLACGDSTTTTPPGTNDPPLEANVPPTIEVVSSPDSLADGESGEWTVRATDANTTSDKQLRFIIAEYVGMGADTAEVSGPQAQANFSRSYPESGPKDVRFRAVDRGGRSSSVVTSTVTVFVPTFEYTFRFTDMTDHHNGLSGGELRIGETTYPVNGDSVTIELPAGNVDVRYFAPNYENRRQVVRERDGTPYGDRFGFAWAREAGVAITLPPRDVPLELFAQPDDWDSPIDLPTARTGAEQYQMSRSDVGGSWPHTFVCEANDPSGADLDDGVLEIGYLINDDPADPYYIAPMTAETERQGREFMEDVLPNQASERIRVVWRGVEIQAPGPGFHINVAQDTISSLFGSASRSWDSQTGCVTQSFWYAPEFDNPSPAGAMNEGLQSMVFHAERGGNGGRYIIGAETPLTLSEFAKQAIAVMFAYGPVPRLQFDW